MKLTSETIEIQEKFASYCRSGKLENIPGLTENRVHHYKRLTNNAVINTLEQAFPITEEILTSDEWNKLVMDFIENHDSQTPQIWKLPFEFYEYVQENDYTETLGKPWLDDLLYFEWVEIEIHTMPDSPVENYKVKEIEQDEKLVFNPDYKILKLAYPVHLYPIDQAKSKKANYFVLIFRELDSGSVKFIDLTILFAILIEKLAIDKKTFGQTLKEISQLFGIEDKNMLEGKIRGFIKELRTQGFYLGISA